MLEFIRRMYGQDELRQCLSQLFGKEDFREEILSLSGIDRDDEITEEYCQELRLSCKYPYVLRALVMHSDKDRLYFPLIYATRSLAGVDVFKNTESKAMKAQENQRAQVEQKKKTQGGQQVFLDFQEPPNSEYFDNLRDRYLNRAKERVTALQEENKIVEYDKLWIAALSYPMVWKSDLNGWLKEWRDQGRVVWKGMSPRERTLKQGAGHFLERITNLPFE